MAVNQEDQDEGRDPPWARRLFFVHLREYIERIMDERDRLYDARFRAAETAVSAALAAQEKAVGAALAAQEKQTSSSFIASEKAIVKAEDAQRDYNQRSNEFRGQLDDQAKMLMPRNEANTMFGAMEEKLRALASAHAARIDATQNDVASLRESRSAVGGKDAGISWIGALAVGVATIIGTLLAVYALVRP